MWSFWILQPFTLRDSHLATMIWRIFYVWSYFTNNIISNLRRQRTYFTENERHHRYCLNDLNLGLSWLLDWNSPEEPLYQWWCRSIRDGSSWIDVNVIRNHY